MLGRKASSKRVAASRSSTNQTQIKNDASIKTSRAEKTSVLKKHRSMTIRSDSLGYNPDAHDDGKVKIESLSYQIDESEVFRAHAASQHYRTRGNYWNDGKSEILLRYINLALIGVIQGCIAYSANFVSKSFIDVSGCFYRFLLTAFQIKTLISSISIFI